MKIPIKTFIDDMEKLLEMVFRPTDPVALPDCKPRREC